MTRDELVSSIAARLGDSAHSVWSATELTDLIDRAIEGLYPTFFQKRVATTTAEAGPEQVQPVGARNIYFVGLLRSTSTRVRKVRGWLEGDSTAIVPKTGITGQTLIWGWTTGWDAPTSGVEPLDVPAEAIEVVLLRVQIAALEKVLNDQSKQEKYHALFVRHIGGTTDEIATTLDALHASLRDREERAPKLPEIER